MIEEYYGFYKRNFPYIIRNKETVMKILNDSNNKTFEKRDENGLLIGLCLCNKNTIYLLAVDSNYRNKGIGSSLLEEAQFYIKNGGYERIVVGVGEDYIMPGIPMRSKPYDEVLNKDNILELVNDDAYYFFKKRGFEHSWDRCNCFDMIADLDEVNIDKYNIGDVIDGITYRWANVSDIPRIKLCVDDGHKDFTKYYMEEKRYLDNSKKKVLIAEKENEVLGCLIVSYDIIDIGIGSVGCTVVSHKNRGKHIAVNMILIGTNYLKQNNVKKGYVGYTYSGLDKMYGYAGYSICMYFSMAKKKI